MASREELEIRKLELEVCEKERPLLMCPAFLFGLIAASLLVAGLCTATHASQGGRQPQYSHLLEGATAVVRRTPSATPPHLASLGREQKISYTFDSDDLMRVWIVYVNQGDGILIQLPPKCNYDLDTTDGDPTESERVDILIDGGSNPLSDGWRIEEFITTLYTHDSPTIEYAVITHHDQDHIAGLTQLLEGGTVGVQAVYHNGLASYRPGVRDFPTDRRPANAVVDMASSTRLRRGMAFLQTGSQLMQTSYLVDSLTQLRTRFNDGEFQGTYDRLAGAIVDKQAPIPVSAFIRAHEGGDFIAEREGTLGRGVDLSGISLEVLWPLDPCRRYGDWGETINGNSVTFKLTYGDFEMLFTGDHNNDSEDAWIEGLEDSNQLGVLSCDVLKVPHHASKHNSTEFLEAVDPVISVASMGDAGFRLTGYKHPSDQVIKTLGGAHRVYCTQIHEKKFKWSDLTSASDIEELEEFTHILIETDGKFFRLVELPDDEPSLISAPPTVQQTRRSNGTRWVKAK